MATATTSVRSIEQAIATVEDPELPVSIADLGMVRSVVLEPGGVVVSLAPTFLACPARWMVENDVRRVVQDQGDVGECRVQWLPGGWSADDVTPAGRRALAAAGLTLPEADGSLRCPFCGSADVEETSPFGSAVCRTSAFCADCRTPLEVLKTKKPVSASPPSGHRPPA